jgi:D-tyrosyl-tRNA(Tyr) deacylase
LEASVTVDGEMTGQIGSGLLALVGVAQGDDEATVDWAAEKMLGLRIFGDEAGKMNLSVADVGGSILLVSQFTLLGDCRKGRRPSFVLAAPPELANRLYEYLGRVLAQKVPVAFGRFAAHMKVSLINDGPVTMILERN